MGGEISPIASLLETDPGTATRLKLYVRGSAPGADDRLDATIDRLERLDAARMIDEIAVHTWDRRVRSDVSDGSPRVRSYVSDRVAEFEAWADRNGMTLRPSLDHRLLASAFTGDAQEVIVLPVMCLAVYADGVLCMVAPCSDGDTAYTVDDCLSILEVESDLDSMSPPRPSS